MHLVNCVSLHLLIALDSDTRILSPIFLRETKLKAAVLRLDALLWRKGISMYIPQLIRTRASCGAYQRQTAILPSLKKRQQQPRSVQWSQERHLCLKPRQAHWPSQGHALTDNDGESASTSIEAPGLATPEVCKQSFGCLHWAVVWHLPNIFGIEVFRSSPWVSFQDGGRDL